MIAGRANEKHFLLKTANVYPVYIPMNVVHLHTRKEPELLAGDDGVLPAILHVSREGRCNSNSTENVSAMKNKFYYINLQTIIKFITNLL